MTLGWNEIWCSQIDKGCYKMGEQIKINRVWGRVGLFTLFHNLIMYNLWMITRDVSRDKSLLMENINKTQENPKDNVLNRKYGNLK